MHVIITAPEAISLFETAPKGPQEATFDGNHFYVAGIKLGKTDCQPVFTKANTKGITSYSTWKLKVSDRFLAALNFSKENSEQAKKLLKLISGNYGGELYEKYPVNYLDLEADGTVTFMDYLKAQAIELVGGDMYNNKNRSSCAPGAVFSKVLSANAAGASSTYCEEFTNMIRSFANFDKIVAEGIITEVEGKDIVKYYHNQYYVEGHGTLNKSCMRSSENTRQIEFYNLNKSVVRMAVLFDDSKKRIKARALIWRDTEGVELLDRAYGVDGVSETTLKNYAKMKGYTLFDRQNEPMRLIQLDVPMVKYYPYMDTFKYIDILNGYLSNNSNHPALNQQATTAIQNTSGERSITMVEVRCGATQENILTKDALYCSYEGFYAKKELVVVMKNGMSCLKKNAIPDAITGELIMKEGAILIEGLGYTIAVDVKDLIIDGATGNWLRKEDAEVCDYSNKFYHNRAMTSVGSKRVQRDYANLAQKVARYTYKENLILA